MSEARSTQSDAGLVQALRAGDSAAWEQVVERHGERMYRLAVSVTGARDDAEDAVQSALITAVRTIDTLDDDARFGSWIDNLVASEAYRRLLARPRSTEQFVIDAVLPPIDRAGHFEPMSDWSSWIEASDHQSELRHVMSDAVAALPPDYRAALVLHDVQGMSDTDIAGVLVLDPSAVRARVHQARLFLRDRLSHELETAHHTCA
jgi:RNA polymerase sigma-70 factor (ECF subfamily)